MFCSHGGNKLFPAWEHLAQNNPRFSANKAGLLKIKLALLTDNDGVLTKSVHLSHRMAPSPLNKGILRFSSLPSSLPFLSQISPVISPVDHWRWFPRGLLRGHSAKQRVMGEIKIISTMPESLSVKPIPAIMGEMNIICDNHVYIVVVPAVRHSAPCCLLDTSLLSAAQPVKWRGVPVPCHIYRRILVCCWSHYIYRWLQQQTKIFLWLFARLFVPFRFARR